MARKRLTISLFLVTLVATAGFAAAPARTPAQQRLSHDVYYLASDALEGRYSGSTGARVAAEFIAARFRDLGLNPEGEDGYEGPGVKISGVRGGSPAEKAGFVAGDVVMRFGDRETRNIYDYMYALGDHKPGEEVAVTVKRGSETVQLRVTLEAGGGGGR
jgi:S1-C subfamily serine protease